MIWPTRALFCFFIIVVTLGGHTGYAVPYGAVVLEEGGKPGSSAVVNGLPGIARFSSPRGVAVHSGSGQIFVVESSSAVRKITPSVGVSLLAGAVSVTGSEDDTGAAARFDRPEGVAVDSGGTVYVADTQNHTIRRILSTGEVATVAGIAGFPGSYDGMFGAGGLQLPKAIACAADGKVYVADTGNQTIRQLSFSGGVATMTTIAGQAGITGSSNGKGANTLTAAKFRNPRAIAVAPNGDVFVADTDNHIIRRLHPVLTAGTTTFVTTTFAGSTKVIPESGAVDGAATVARFYAPTGLAIDAAGTMFVADTGNHALRMITTAGVVSTIAGVLGTSGVADGIGVAAKFSSPSGIAVDVAGKIYVADKDNHTIRKATIPGLQPSIVSHPVGRTLAPATGLKVSFSAKVAGPTPLIYHWMRNGVELVDGTGIAGANTPTLSLTDVGTSQEGGYALRVTNPYGSATTQSAPLVLTGQVTWLWASAIGGKSDDAALDLVVQQPVGAVAGALWLAARNGGHVLQKHSTSNGARLLASIIDAKGDGANALARDGATGELAIAADAVDAKSQGKPGLLVKKSALGKTLVSKLFATERGGLFSSASIADGLGVAVNASHQTYLTGYFQGYGKFGATVVSGSGVALGETSSAENHAFLAKYASDGSVLWARDVFSHNDAANNHVERPSVGRAVVVESTDSTATPGSVYFCGSVGPHARFQLGTAHTASDSDYQVFTNTEPSRPFVAKYDSAGSLAWVYLPAYEGQFLAMHLTAAGAVWVTGYQGNPLTSSNHIAVLERLDPATGAVQAPSLQVPHGKGCSLDTDPARGLAWLVLDSDGSVNWGNRSFRVPGYRVIQLDATTLAAHWDLPVFGSTSWPQQTLSEQADIRYGSDGRLYAALTFQDPGIAGAQVEFTGRKTFSLTGRGTDGFLACIAERPLIATQPDHQLVAKGAPVTLSVTSTGTLTPKYQWYKNGKTLAGKTSTSLTLSSAALSDAAAYTVRLSNTVDSVLSRVAQVGVVDVVNQIRPVAIAGSTSLTVPNAGAGLTFAWRKNGGTLPVAPRITGALNKTLVMALLERPGDDGAYDCLVSGPGGHTLASGVTTLSVKIQPEVNAISFSNGVVSEMRHDAPSALNEATSFTITGLPPGLTYNRNTGAITGKATKSGTFPLKITASNVAGSSAPYSATLVIAPLPTGVVGLYTGLLDRDAVLTGNVGARLDFTSTASGSYTGKIIRGLVVTPFVGSLDAFVAADPALVAVIGGRTLSLVLHPVAGTFDGTWSDATPLAVNAGGYRHASAAEAAGYVGKYSLSLAIPAGSVGDASVPQENGVATFTVTAGGAVSLAPKPAIHTLGDHTAVVFASFVSSTGSVVFYQAYDAGLSSALGTIHITVPGATLSGTMDWRKAANGNLLYPAAFGPLSLTVGGGLIP